MALFLHPLANSNTTIRYASETRPDSPDSHHSTSPSIPSPPKPRGSLVVPSPQTDEDEETKDTVYDSSGRVSPPLSPPLIALRVCNTSLAGNGLRTHIIYKFELTMTSSTDISQTPLRRWYIQKKNKDFEKLDEEVRKSTTNKDLLKKLPTLPKQESVMTIYSSDRPQKVRGNKLQQISCTAKLHSASSPST